MINQWLFLIFRTFGFSYPKLGVINQYYLNFNDIFGIRYRCTEFRGQIRFAQQCHSGLFQLIRDTFTFFVCVTAVLYAFSFNDSFIEIIFAALDKFFAVSNEPEWRSLGHNNPLAISFRGHLINIFVVKRDKRLRSRIKANHHEKPNPASD